MQQIDRNRRRKEALEAENQEHDKRAKENVNENLHKLVNMQQEKVQQLKGEGIAEKYLRELQNHKIVF